MKKSTDSLNNYALVKESVSAINVWNAYNGAPIKRGFVNCMYHNDKNPSMRLYEGSKGFYCFACQTGGDVIKLAGDLLGLAPIDTIKRLNADFNIGLDMDMPPDRKKIQEQNWRRQAEEAFGAWIDKASSVLAAYHRILWQAKADCPKLIEQFNPLQIEACNNLDEVSYYLDYLEDNPVKFYRTSRDYVLKIAYRLEGMLESGKVS